MCVDDEKVQRTPFLDIDDVVSNYNRNKIQNVITLKKDVNLHKTENAYKPSKKLTVNCDGDENSLGREVCFKL